MRSDSRGFTLLEVMVALALIGIVLVPLLGIGNRCLAGHHRMGMLTQATLLAQWQMSRIETAAHEKKLTFIAENGAFEAPFENFRWESRYEDGPVENLKAVTLTVFWDAAWGMRSVDLTSFLRTVTK